MLIHQYVKDNNKYMDNCHKYKESPCINYQKVNNLYGKCEMSDVMCGVIGNVSEVTGRWFGGFKKHFD